MSWILKLYLWTFELANQEDFSISLYRVGGRNRNSRCAINHIKKI
jgi:hypothetical protein